MADQKDTRRVWTNAQKDALIKEVALVPRGQSIAPVLEKYDVTDSAFRSMRRRRRMQTEAKPEPHFKPADAAGIRRAVGKGAAKDTVRDLMKEKLDPLPLKTLPPAVPVVRVEEEDFRAATKDRKRILIAEYNKLPLDEKGAWRTAHNVTMALMTYYNGKFKTKAKAPNAPKYDPQELRALVAEYYALPHTGGVKAAWLKEHGLSHQSIFNYRRIVADMNGHANLPAVVQKPVPVQTSLTIPLVEGVRYLEIKRDLYNEIIEDLNRVLKGGR